MGRATFRWTHICFFLDFSFKKDAVPGLRIETRIWTEVQIRASALAPRRYRIKVRYRSATDYGPGICIRDCIPHHTARIRI